MNRRLVALGSALLAPVLALPLLAAAPAQAAPQVKERQLLTLQQVERVYPMGRKASLTVTRTRSAEVPRHCTQTRQIRGTSGLTASTYNLGRTTALLPTSELPRSSGMRMVENTVIRFGTKARAKKVLTAWRRASACGTVEDPTGNMTIAPVQVPALGQEAVGLHVAPESATPDFLAELEVYAVRRDKLVVLVQVISVNRRAALKKSSVLLRRAVNRAF